MDQAPFSYPPTDRETAIRCGRKVFGWAATLQMLSFAMVAYGVFVITWQRTTYYTANQGGFWDWLIAKKDLRETVIAGLCAMIVFTVAALPMGRLAGRAIMHRRRSPVWVGPLSMLLPSLLGSFTGAVVMVFVDKGMAQQVVRYPVKHFLIPLAACCFCIYLSSVLVGMLAGVLLRQMGYEAQERALYGAASGDAMPHVNAGGRVSSALSKKLGSVVFGIAAALQSVLLGCSASLEHIRGSHSRYELQAAFLYIVTGIFFTGMAVLVGRWAGAAISKQPHRALWLAPAMMALPSIVGGVVHVVGCVYSDEYYQISLKYHNWDAMWGHFVSITSLIYVPAALIAVLSGFVLRMFIFPRQSLLMDN